MEPDQEWPITAAADHIRRLRAERDAILCERRERAQRWSVEVADLLGRADPRIKRIIGFGSTFKMWRNYRKDSDVDLAMIGGDWMYGLVSSTWHNIIGVCQTERPIGLARQ